MLTIRYVTNLKGEILVQRCERITTTCYATFLFEAVHLFSTVNMEATQ